MALQSKVAIAACLILSACGNDGTKPQTGVIPETPAYPTPAGWQTGQPTLPAMGPQPWPPKPPGPVAPWRSPSDVPPHPWAAPHQPNVALQPDPAPVGPHPWAAPRPGVVPKPNPAPVAPWGLRPGQKSLPRTTAVRPIVRVPDPIHQDQLFPTAIDPRWIVQLPLPQLPAAPAAARPEVVEHNARLLDIDEVNDVGYLIARNGNAPVNYRVRELLGLKEVLGQDLSQTARAGFGLVLPTDRLVLELHRHQNGEKVRLIAHGIRLMPQAQKARLVPHPVDGATYFLVEAQFEQKIVYVLGGVIKEKAFSHLNRHSPTTIDPTRALDSITEITQLVLGHAHASQHAVIQDYYAQWLNLGDHPSDKQIEDFGDLLVSALLIIGLTG